MTPRIGKPAPAFKATAVVDGQMKEVSLDQFKVSYLYVHITAQAISRDAS